LSFTYAALLVTEAVNPIALGKTRAKQFSLLKTSPKDCQLGDRVMCVQLHGDASFTGQGVVMESLGLSEYHPLFPRKPGISHLHDIQAICHTLRAEEAFTSLLSERPHL
jgi:probable 2-oxoglutarate dehydrogenase E1 component DHKTD1